MPIKKQDLLENEIRKEIYQLLEKKDLCVYDIWKELRAKHTTKGKRGKTDRGYSYKNISRHVKFMVENGFLVVKDPKASSDSHLPKIIYGVA